MNFFINRLDYLDIGNNSYPFIPENIAKEMNLDGMIVGLNGYFFSHGTDVMALLKNTNLRDQLGINRYNALFQHPMMLFLLATTEDEFRLSKEELDHRYGIMEIHLNNFAQALSIGFWFIKDSCVCATQGYWMNLLNDYNAQGTRDMFITRSDGSCAVTSFTDPEMDEAINRMYEIYRYLLPDESKMGRFESVNHAGSTVWMIDQAISSEGNSFARALKYLQEARRTGVLSSKIDKYCSVLECLYAINKEHKKNIADITAAFIGTDAEDRDDIRNHMREAYGVRSDGSHGDNLKYLKQNDTEQLKALSTIVDNYVRAVFRKVICQDRLNYDSTPASKANTRAYFLALLHAIYPPEVS